MSSTSDTDPPASLQTLLASESRKGSRRKRLLWGGGALGLAAVIVAVVQSGGPPPGPRYATEPVSRGNIVVEVSATGNLQPTNNVDVGSELSGIVTEVLVDDNDRVSKGQVLARLDTAKLRDAVTKSRANLDAAQAQVLQARATSSEAKAVLSRYQQVFEASGGKVPSQSEMDTAKANLERADANEAGARASVVQAQATVQSDQTNLEKANIRSPIDGIVLTRAVEPGQTVAATLQAPVLFKLAEDLAKMELQVDIDEADVGQVKVGQGASFSVDAWPGRRYTGVITRVGYGSAVKEGVVSYPTVLAVENADLSLRPGMTATAEIVTQSREKVLLVPNAALRFSPESMGPKPPHKSGGLVGQLMPRMPPPALRPRPQGDQTPRVWVLRDGEPVPLEVRPGASNGQMTEIADGSIDPGTEVITETLAGAP